MRGCSFNETIVRSIGRISREGLPNNCLQTLYNQVKVTPISAGFSLGSSNWVIQTHKYKIGYVAHSSTVSTTMAAAMANQGSVKTQPFHAQSMDETYLENADALIISPGAFTSPVIKAGLDAYLAEFCNQIGIAVRGGGSVLVPSYPCGLLLDLFPILNVYLNNIGFPRLPIYFVSRGSETILATANISAEWFVKQHTSRERQAKS